MAAVVGGYFCPLLFFQEEIIGFVTVFEFQFSADFHFLRIRKTEEYAFTKCVSLSMWVCDPVYL